MLLILYISSLAVVRDSLGHNWRFIQANEQVAKQHPGMHTLWSATSERSWLVSRLQIHKQLSTTRLKVKPRVIETLCEETLFRDLLHHIIREPLLHIHIRHDVLYGNQMSKCRKDYLRNYRIDSSTRSAEDLVSLFLVIRFPNCYDMISLCKGLRFWF